MGVIKVFRAPPSCGDGTQNKGGTTGWRAELTGREAWSPWQPAGFRDESGAGGPLWCFPPRPRGLVLSCRGNHLAPRQPEKSQIVYKFLPVPTHLDSSPSIRQHYTLPPASTCVHTCAHTHNLQPQHVYPHMCTHTYTHIDTHIHRHRHNLQPQRMNTLPPHTHDEPGSLARSHCARKKEEVTQPVTRGPPDWQSHGQ